MTGAGLVCGASFSSSENTLALITGNGEWTEWKDVVPSKYASPTAAVSPSEIDFMSAVEEKSAEDFLDTEVDAMDDDLEEEDDFVEYDDDAKGIVKVSQNNKSFMWRLVRSRKRRSKPDPLRQFRK